MKLLTLTVDARLMCWLALPQPTRQGRHVRQWLSFASWVTTVSEQQMNWAESSSAQEYTCQAGIDW